MLAAAEQITTVVKVGVGVRLSTTDLVALELLSMMMMMVFAAQRPNVPIGRPRFCCSFFHFISFAKIAAIINFSPTSQIIQI